MVIYNGYCRPLKSKVDFEVLEVNAIDTSRGVKWQIKGNYDSHKISVFAKESVAKELEAKLIKPDFFEAHTDTVIREPKIHEIPLSQELDEPMMAFDAEEIKIYHSEELAPFPFFDAEVFDAYDNYGVMEEETKEVDFELYGTIKQLESALYTAMAFKEDEEYYAGNISPTYIQLDYVNYPINNLFFDDEFDSLIIMSDGEGLDMDDLEDDDWSKFSKSTISVSELYKQFNQVFNQISMEDIASVKIKTNSRTANVISIDFEQGYKDETWSYGLGILNNENYDEDEGDNTITSFDDVIEFTNIKALYEAHGDVPVYMLLVDTDDSEVMGDTCTQWAYGAETDESIEVITGFEHKWDDDEECFSMFNLETMENVKKDDFDNSLFTLSEFKDIIEGDLKDVVGDEDGVSTHFSISLSGVYRDGKFQEFTQAEYGFGFGGKYIDGALYLGIEKQNAINNLEPSIDYSKLKVAELKVILEARDLPKSGKKAELIQRLEEDDDDEDYDGGDMIDIDDATESGMALTYDELNEFVDERIENEEGEDYAYLSTQFTDEDGDRAITATVIVREDETDTDFVGTAVPEIPLSYDEDEDEDYEDDYDYDEDDEEYEAQEHVIDVDEDEDSISITYTKEAEQSPFTTDIGFITFHSQENNQEVGEDDEDVIPMIFDQFIPPEIWGDLKDSQQKDFIATGDESILVCSKCGMTKADMRASEGYCPTVDPMNEAYIAKVNCPYSKHFAPMHWINKEPTKIIEATKKAMNNVYFDDNTPVEAMAAETIMNAEDTFHAPNRYSQPTNDRIKSMVVSKADYYGAIHSIPETVSAAETNDGTSMKLGYFESESNIMEGLFTDTLMSEEGTPVSFMSESQPLPELWAEDLNDFKPPFRESLIMSAEHYEADENSKVIDKYDYYRNIMNIGDDSEVVDMGKSVVIINDDILEPDDEVKSTICVGCETDFKKVNVLDKKGMCVDCGEDSINLSQLQRYKEGGIATFEESDYPIEMVIEEEVDDYMDDTEITEDGYDMFEEDYEEWEDNYNSETLYPNTKPLNTNKWIMSALGLGGIAILLAPDKVRELFKRK